MSEENLPRPIQSYVRRIARSVARGDGDLADDLEQATFLVALQSGPGKRELLRPWLYSVCANTLRGLLRRDRTDRDAAQVDPFANEGEPLDIVLAFRASLISSVSDALEKQLEQAEEAAAKCRSDLTQCEAEIAEIDDRVAALKKDFGDKTRDAELLKRRLENA